MKLEELDLSTKNVKIGALNVLQGLSGAAIQSIRTAIESTLGATQSISGELQAFIAKMLEDGLISPEEKKQLRRELGIIQTEYPIIRSEALGAGVPEFSDVMITYDASYYSLYTYLYTDLKVFDDMSAFTTVANRPEFEGKFKTYYTARDALRSAVTEGLLLKVLEDVRGEIEATNVRIDNVRLGDIIDGAIKRSMLDSGLEEELSKVTSSLFPNGLDRQNTFDFIKPHAAINEEMIDYLLSLVGEQEEQVELRANEIRLVSTKTDEVSTRMASLKVNFDSIAQMVAEIIPLADGQIANLTRITETADAIEMLATKGRYNPGTGEIDSYSLAELRLLSDRFSVFIGGGGNDFDAASWLVKKDEIKGLVQNAVKTDEELIANISEMVQDPEAIRFNVAQLRSETIERIDDALITAQAGLLINATEITLGVQNLEKQVQSLLTVQSDRINALVQDVAKSSASILSIKSEQIGSMVKGGGAQAYLSLSVTLPATIDADARNLMIRALGPDPVNAVYVLTAGGFWYVSPDSTIFAQKTLKNGLRAAGLLGSQIALDADEILMGGKVKAKHIDVEDLNALGTITVGTSQVTGLTEISNGKIKTSLLDVQDILGENAVFRGSLQASSGLFSGSIESGPLVLNISPPANTSFSTNNKLVVTLVEEIINSGIRPGRYECSGMYNGYSITTIDLIYPVLGAEAVAPQETYWVKWKSREWSSEYEIWKYKATWTGARGKDTYRLSFYSNNGLIATITDKILAGSITWTLTSSVQVDHYYARDFNEPTSARPPSSQITPVGASIICANGFVSFTASAYTMKLINLPAYSESLPPWTVYLEDNGASGYIVKVKK